jgi:serine/threonine protein kinase
VNLFGIGAITEKNGEASSYIVVMERLDASLRDTLDKYLAKGRQPPLEQALRWLLETAQGLAECHEANVVHSDVKAANTLLTARREAKIGDLGAGRVTRGLSATASLGGSTASGNARGSVLWLSSELVDDQFNMPSKASDTYAWAVMAWEILSVRCQARRFCLSASSFSLARLPVPAPRLRRARALASARLRPPPIPAVPPALPRRGRHLGHRHLPAEEHGGARRWLAAARPHRRAA